MSETPLVPYPRALEAFPVLRQSLLSDFDSCGLSTHFTLQYRRGHTTHYQARGQIFHRFAAKALREMAAHGETGMEVDVALAILSETLRQDDVDRECPTCEGAVKPGIIDGWQRECENGHRFETELVNIPMSQIEDLVIAVKKWSHDNTWSTQDLVSVEDRYFAKLSYPNPHGGRVERVVTGKPDAVMIAGENMEWATVLDWKETWAMPAPSEVSDEGYFQQRFYGWLVMSNHPSVMRVTLREFYPRYSESREAAVNRDQMDDIEAEIAALVERFDRSFENEEWTAAPGKHCGWCVRPAACTIPKFAREAGRIVTDEDAKQAAYELLVAQAIVKQSQEALKVHTDLHGPIPVRDKKGPRVIGFRESSRTSRPTREQLEEALRRGDVNLDSLYQRSKTTRFEVHVPKAKPSWTTEEASLLERLELSVQQANERLGARQDAGEYDDEVPF